MKEGTFVVTEADEETAVVRDVADGQIHTLASNPDLTVEEVVEGTLEAQPPMEVTYELVELDRQYAVEVGRSDEPPTQMARDLAAEQAAGEVTTRERAGTGEVHVLTVPAEDTDSAVGDVLDDIATVERAARLGVERVEVRADDGAVSVRYLP